MLERLVDECIDCHQSSSARSTECRDLVLRWRFASLVDTRSVTIAVAGIVMARGAAGSLEGGTPGCFESVGLRSMGLRDNSSYYWICHIVVPRGSFS